MDIIALLAELKTVNNLLIKAEKKLNESSKILEDYKKELQYIEDKITELKNILKGDLR